VPSDSSNKNSTSVSLCDCIKHAVAALHQGKLGKMPWKKAIALFVALPEFFKH
jgi:hypothetical protein